MTIRNNWAAAPILCRRSASFAQAQSDDAQSYPSQPIVVQNRAGAGTVDYTLRAVEPDPVGSTSDEFARTIAKDVDTWAAVAKAANIRIEP